MESNGTPPNGNANFAWIQHIIHHLAPTGRAGVVLANGSLSSQSGGEGDIRRRLIEADLGGLHRGHASATLLYDADSRLDLVLQQGQDAAGA